jgi:hypothetical protein
MAHKAVTPCKVVLSPQSRALVTVLLVEQDRVTILSQYKRVQALQGEPCPKRVVEKHLEFIADVSVMVKPGEPGYMESLIDPFERAGLVVTEPQP